MKKIRMMAASFAVLLGMIGASIPAKAAELTPRAELNGAEEYALARFCAAECEGEPFICRLSVAAVMLNRLSDPRFPDTVTGILSDGGYKAAPVRETDLASARWAVRVALMGVDPTDGSLWWAHTDTAEAADLIPKLTVGKRVFGVRAKEVGGGASLRSRKLKGAEGNFWRCEFALRTRMVPSAPCDGMWYDIDLPSLQEIPPLLLIFCCNPRTLVL